MVAASAFSIRVAKLSDSGPVVEGVWSGVCTSIVVLPPAVCGWPYLYERTTNIRLTGGDQSHRGRCSGRVATWTRVFLPGRHSGRSQAEDGHEPAAGFAPGSRGPCGPR